MSDDGNWKQRIEQAETRIFNLEQGVQASQQRALRLEKECDEWEQTWGTRGTERTKLTARIERLEHDLEGERLAREGAQQHRRDAEARLMEATERNLELARRLESAERALADTSKGQS